MLYHTGSKKTRALVLYRTMFDHRFYFLCYKIYGDLKFQYFTTLITQLHLWASCKCNLPLLIFNPIFYITIPKIYFFFFWFFIKKQNKVSFLKDPVFQDSYYYKYTRWDHVHTGNLYRHRVHTMYVKEKVYCKLLLFLFMLFCAHFCPNQIILS